MARILVADDDVDIRELVEFKLSTLGHEIIAVNDGAAAVDACREYKPDLVILMNPIYVAEVQRDLNEMGSSAEVHAVGR